MQTNILKQEYFDVLFRWRVLALKVKFGLGANFLAIKKRNLNDISTFIDHETEVVNEASLKSENRNENENENQTFRKQQKKIRWTWKENA